MTETIVVMPTRLDQQHFAQALVEQARSEGVELIGSGGLLTGLTKTVLESALEAEITEHLGYDSMIRRGATAGNSRNGTRPKTVLTPDRSGADQGAPGPGQPHSSRASSGNGNVASTGSTRSSCRSPRVG